MRLRVALGTVFILIIALQLFVTSLINDGDATNFLRSRGYKDVSIVSKSYLFIDWAGCSRVHGVKFEAIATDSNNKKVVVAVCMGSGLFAADPTVILH